MAAYKLTDGDKAVVEALAGVFGTLTATCFMFPMDTARARVQASLRTERRKKGKGDGTDPPGTPTKGVLCVLEQTARDEGISALYRGIGIRSAHSFSQAFVYFFTYNYLRRKVESARKKKIGWGTSILLGLIAGWCNTLITEPLDVIAIVTQTTPRPKRSSSVGGEDDIRRCSCGGMEDVAPAVSAEASGSGNGHGHGHGHGKGPHAAANGNAAAVANGDHRPRAYQSLDERSVIRRRPPPLRELSPLPAKKPNLYSSLYVSLLLALTPAIQSTVFEQARSKLIARRVARGGPHSISAFEAFLLGAAAKGCAASIMYPAIRTKVLLQAGTSTSTTIVGTIRGVVEREGPKGLYRGIQAQIVSAFVVGAILLTVKEKTFGASYVTVRWLQSQRLAASGKRLTAA